MTIAVSTASPERAFSLVKLVKTRLRSRMSQPMLDAIMRINLLLKFEDLLSFLPDCAETWITKQGRRQNFGDGKIPELYNEHMWYSESSVTPGMFMSNSSQSRSSSSDRGMANSLGQHNRAITTL